MEVTEETQNPEVVNQAVNTHEKTPQESFAELRKAKDDLERQLWQAQKEREMLEKHMQQQRAPIQQEEEFDYRQIEQEEFPDGKKFAKAFSSIDKKLSGYEQKLVEKDFKIQALEFAVDHADFKSIVTPDNIAKYITNDEDNRESVEKSANPLRKVYNLIKKEIALEQKLKQPPSQEQRRLEEKEERPKTSSIGVRSEAVNFAAQVSNSRMTKQQKSALWAETMAAARR